MKKLFLPAIIALIVAISSCKDETSYMPQEAQMKDSIFKAYPTTVASITIQVLDKTQLNIVLGGARLYAADADKKQQMANDLGLMALRIFGKDSYLKTGRLIITKDERNSSENPPDGITTNINLDSLTKIVYPASK